MNMSQFWSAVRAREARIEEEYPYIVSVESARPGMRGGVVMQASRRVAAERLTEGTHVLASAGQVERQKRTEAVAAALQPPGTKPAKVVYLKRKGLA